MIDKVSIFFKKKFNLDKQSKFLKSTNTHFYLINMYTCLIINYIYFFYKNCKILKIKFVINKNL